MSYGTRGLANYHPEIFNPVVHWKLNSSLVASFTNQPLLIEFGTERYTDILPGVRGFYFDGSTNLYRNQTDVNTTIVGDMTFLCLASIRQQSGPSAARVITSNGGVGESEDTNVIWSYFINSATGPANLPGYFAEFNSGTNTGGNLTGQGITPTVAQIGFVRIAGQVQFIQNGVQMGPTLTGLTAPTGGTSGRLRIGADGSLSSPCTKGTAIASAIFWNKALTPAQLKETYNLSLGPSLGLIR